jgi:LPS export ABC transporter protein LptC/lipopolysaccharide transport protein LptA
VAELRAERVNFRPLRMITALRVVIAALLIAFAVLVFLSFGKKEEEPVRIQISQPTETPGEKVVDLSDTFFITGSKGGAESFKLLADHVTGFVGDKKTLRGVHLEVVNEGGERLFLSGNEGQFDMADKKAQLSGNVEVAGKNGFKLSTASLYFDGQRDVIFTSEEIAFQSSNMAGTGRGLNYLTRGQTLKIPAEVHVTLTPGSASELPVEISSGDMTLGMHENEVIFNESVRMIRGQETLTGNYLKVTLDSSRHKILFVKAYGQVSATFFTGTEGGTLSQLETDSLLATMAPDGRRAERMEALGHCRLTSQGMTATSESLQAEASEDRIALRGEPLILDGKSRIAAQEIDVHPSLRSLEARGDVKTTFLGSTPGKPSSSPSFFGDKEPVYFQAARLLVEDGGNVARYSGSARGWQGDDSLQAEEILLRFGDRSMSANRNVLCRFSGQRDGKDGSDPAAPKTPTIIVASSMDYVESEGTVHFRDAVKMTGNDSTVLADRMHVSLTDPATEGKRRVSRVLAEGSVRFTHLTNSGVADRLTYTPADGLAEMQRDAGLAEVVDSTNGRILRGKTLTFDTKGNRVLTETTEGGRTWITLNPKDKDTRGLESKIGH